MRINIIIDSNITINYININYYIDIMHISIITIFSSVN